MLVAFLGLMIGAAMNLEVWLGVIVTIIKNKVEVAEYLGGRYDSSSFMGH